MSERTGKHTPGPWSFRQGVEQGTDGPVYDYGTIEAGQGFHPKGFQATGIMSQANARLIAAAPELLEALEVIIDHAQAEVDHYHASMKGYRQERHDSLDADMKLARDALAKALGNE